METLVLSGGGAKGAFTAGVVYHMLKVRQHAATNDAEKAPFDFAIGTSTGSLVAGPALLGERYDLRDSYVGVTNNDILNNSWFGKLASLIFSTPILVQADMDPLYQLLKLYYIENGKLELIRNKAKLCVVTMVNTRTGKIQFMSSGDLGIDYQNPETYVRGVLASASEPVFCQPIQVYKDEPGHPNEKDLFYDGGVKEFLPLTYAYRNGATKVWAISTHKPKFNETDWGGTKAPDDVNILSVLKWVLDSTLNEVERGDLFRGVAYSRLGRARKELTQLTDDFGLNAIQKQKLLKLLDNVFPFTSDQANGLYVISPSRAMSASLEFDPKEMYTYFINGRLDAEKYFEDGNPMEFGELDTDDPFIRSLL